MADFVSLNFANSSVQVYKYGATVTSWKVGGQEQLFTSSKAILNGSKPIRGGYFIENHAGIPIVWPQFAKPEGAKLPQHAFARNSFWELESANESQLKFKLTSAPKEYDWPYRFILTYTVSLFASSLKCELSATNLEDKPIYFTSLLHTYFKINDLGKCQVSKLSDTCYDKALDKTRKQEMPVTFHGEVDLVFMDAPDVTEIRDGNRTVTVEKHNFRDVVVWNPSQAKAGAMTDLEENGHLRFVCVEAGSVWKPIELEPKLTWTAGITLTVDHSD